MRVPRASTTQISSLARTVASSPSRSRPTTRSPLTGTRTPDAAGDQGKGDNAYKVSVTANGGDPFILTVNVTDVDEAGVVKIDQPQPQVGRALKAIDFDDPDEAKDQVISWESGTSAEGPWTDLSITTASYTPVEADEGNWLRVTYTYNDKFGDGKTVSAVSENAVEAKTKANAAPDFPEEDDVTTALEGNDNEDKQDGETATDPYVRSVAENKAVGTVIGDPIAATDADNDVLLYSISNTTGVDGDCFDIDPRSGQLKVAKKVNFEATTTACSGTTPRDPDDTYPNAYVFTVTATDPSSAGTTVHVRVNVTDVNETPEFDDDSKKLTTLYVVENSTNSGDVFKEEASAKLEADPDQSPPDGDSGNDAEYTATDGDGGADTITYSLEGADR